MAISIIFLCHGSICRSPAAECIAQKYINELGLENCFAISSRALSSEELGNGIYPPIKNALLRASIPLLQHRSVVVSQSEFDKADYVFYMDGGNKRWLSYVLNDYSKAKIISCYEKEPFEIEDPWYSGNYDLVVTQIGHCVKSIIDSIIKERGLK